MAARTAFRSLCARARSVPITDLSNSAQISKIFHPLPVQPQASWHVSPQKRFSHRQLSSQAESTSSIPKTGSVSSESVVLQSEVHGVGLPASTEVPPVPQSLLWRAFKWSFGLTATAAVAGTSYVTYSYDNKSVENKLEEWRSSLKEIRRGGGTSGRGELVDGGLGEKRPDSLGGSWGRSAFVKAGAVLLDGADLYVQSRQNIEDQIHGWSVPSSDRLLPDLAPHEQGVYTLVVDLNDTLVYCDWRRERGWRTYKRPGADAFLERMAHYYEVVVFSDQLAWTVDPMLERLDPKGATRYRLYRDSTHYKNGAYIKDLSNLNRDPRHVIYLTAHPETCAQSEHVLQITPWKKDAEDTALLDLFPFLEFVARQHPPDIRTVLSSYQGQDIPSAFKERHKELQRRLSERSKQRPALSWVPRRDGP